MSRAPSGEIDFDDATWMAGRALQLMAEHNVPATPQNFEVWFRFVLGTAPELSKTLNILIDNKREFDSATNRSLYLTHIAAEADREPPHAEISDQLHKLLSGAQGYLARSLSDHRDHVQALGGVAAQIQENADPRSIIQGLMGELSKAVTRATTMESHFNASLQELDTIRSNLAVAEQRSKTDALTGLANRLALDEFLRASQMAATKSGEPLSIFVLDVDNFKSFNDKFGHQFGDQVLQLISRMLKDGVRSQDLAARFGGEELVGVLPGADIHACAAVAERIRQTISQRQVTRRSTGEILSSVTVSIGVAQLVPGETLATLFERCDRALYAAKRGGRNRTVTELALGRDTAAA